MEENIIISKLESNLQMFHLDINFFKDRLTISAIYLQENGRRFNLDAYKHWRIRTVITNIA